METTLGEPPRNLSSDEVRCLQLLAAGWPDQALASELRWNADTIGSNLSALYGKLGTRSDTHAVAVAIREGIIDFDDQEDTKA